MVGSQFFSEALMFIQDSKNPSVKSGKTRTAKKFLTR